MAKKVGRRLQVVRSELGHDLSSFRVMTLFFIVKAVDSIVLHLEDRQAKEENASCTSRTNRKNGRRAARANHSPVIMDVCDRSHSFFTGPLQF